MTQDIREQLLGYIFGALDDVEMEVVRRRLEKDEAWREELERLEASLPPLEQMPDVDPPEGLVEQTCATVEAFVESEQVTLAGSRLASGMQAASRGRISLADFVVAAGIFASAALLFFPAISNSRHIARRNQCQNNLRQIGLALADYSDKAGVGYFPRVAVSGKRAFAGIYAPVLRDCGYLLDSNLVLCPSSQLALSELPFRVPTLAEIDAAVTQEWLQMRQMAGGSYGYNLGMVVDGQHRPPQNLGRAHFVLAGDLVPVIQSGFTSRRHGRDGQNLLFEDGRVKYVVAVSEGLDDPFRNRLGVIEAGIGEGDAVIAPSFYPPFKHVPSEHYRREDRL